MCVCVWVGVIKVHSLWDKHTNIYGLNETAAMDDEVPNQFCCDSAIEWNSIDIKLCNIVNASEPQHETYNFSFLPLRLFGCGANALTSNTPRAPAVHHIFTEIVCTAHHFK